MTLKQGTLQQHLRTELAATDNGGEYHNVVLPSPPSTKKLQTQDHIKDPSNFDVNMNRKTNIKD